MEDIAVAYPVAERSLHERLNHRQILEVINSIEGKLARSKPDGKKNHERETTRLILLMNIYVEIMESYLNPKEVTFLQYRIEKPASYHKALSAIEKAVNVFGVNI